MKIKYILFLSIATITIHRPLFGMANQGSQDWPAEQQEIYDDLPLLEEVTAEDADQNLNLSQVHLLPHETIVQYQNRMRAIIKMLSKQYDLNRDAISSNGRYAGSTWYELLNEIIDNAQNKFIYSAYYQQSAIDLAKYLKKTTANYSIDQLDRDLLVLSWIIRLQIWKLYPEFTEWATSILQPRIMKAKRLRKRHYNR